MPATTLAIIENCLDAVSFEGDEISDNLKAIILEEGLSRGGNGRYLFAPLPQEEAQRGPYRLNELSGDNGVSEIMLDNRAFYGLVIDHEILAALICDQAQMPLIRITSEIVEE